MQIIDVSSRLQTDYVHCETGLFVEDEKKV